MVIEIPLTYQRHECEWWLVSSTGKIGLDAPSVRSSVPFLSVWLFPSPQTTSLLAASQPPPLSVPTSLPSGNRKSLLFIKQKAYSESHLCPKWNRYDKVA